MPQGARTARVGEEFREVLAEAIQKLKDPRVGFVTVTGVKVSPDLKRAWVYYTALGEEKERAGTRAGLMSAAPHLRRTLGSQVRLKFVPDLEFQEDISGKEGARIEALLAELNRQERA